MRFLNILSTFLAIMAILCIFSSFAPPSQEAGASDSRVVEECFGNLPLYFIENQGQVDGEACYYLKGADKTVYFRPGGVTYVLTGGKGCHRERWSVALDFLDADQEVKPRGEDRQGAVFNFFKGKPEAWAVGIPSFGKLVYEDLWPGIDLIYHGTANRLKYEFRVEPGADAGRIGLSYRGASDVVLRGNGVLEVTTPCGGFEDDVPYAYQDFNEGRRKVAVRYAAKGRIEETAFSFGFEVSEYDARKTLVIDPAVLVYCGYIGGGSVDVALAVALDQDGNAYVAGYTYSEETTFPVTVGPDLSFNQGTVDAFVAKVDRTGTSLEYCGYIGGDGAEWNFGIAVDGSGCAYVAGYTWSDEKTFPVIVGPDLTFNGGGDLGTDAFVAKINASGTALDYCGYIGGTEDDSGLAIAVDQNSCACVAGKTRSDQSSFPVALGPDLTFNGGLVDAFVARVSALGDSLDYCGYIGGAAVDSGLGIAVDPGGCAYVTGETNSDEMSFPVIKGPDLAFNGAMDAFIAKIDVSGTFLDYCGYIGGASVETGSGVAVDSSGCACVTGETRSDETSFPVAVGPDLTFNKGGNLDDDAFVAKVTASGDSLAYCGYIGGSGDDEGYAIALDPEGCAYVTGKTKSDEMSFPVVLGPDLRYNGDDDVFVAKVTASGASLDYCGYIGGPDDDDGYGIAVDRNGNACVTGFTECDETSFPVVVGPDLSFNGWNSDAFISKVLAEGVFCDQYTFSESRGGTVTLHLSAGKDKAHRRYLILGSMTGTQPGTILPSGLILPVNWDPFTQLIVSGLNTFYFMDFIGALDASGQSTALFNHPRPLPPGHVGEHLYFAFFLDAPWDFASNPVAIEIVP